MPRLLTRDEDYEIDEAKKTVVHPESRASIRSRTSWASTNLYEAANTLAGRLA